MQVNIEIKYYRGWYEKKKKKIIKHYKTFQRSVDKM